MEHGQKKGKKSYFGYKLHSKVDINYDIIRDIKITTASVHDSRVDLSKKEEVVYRDRGYSGTTPNGYFLTPSELENSATMKKGSRNHPIEIKDKLRNKRISSKRALVERSYAVIKTVFKSAHVRVTTVARVGIKIMFAAFNFNLYQLITLNFDKLGEERKKW